MGRPPIGKVAMTGAERVRLHRLKHGITKPVTKQPVTKPITAVLGAAKKKKTALRYADNSNQPATHHDENEEGDTREEQWGYSLANLCGDIIARQPYWDKHFIGWKDYELPSHFKTLLAEAATALASITKTVAPALSREPDAQAEIKRLAQALAEARKENARLSQGLADARAEIARLRKAAAKPATTSADPDSELARVTAKLARADATIADQRRALRYFQKRPNGKIDDRTFTLLRGHFHPDRVQDPEQKARYRTTFEVLGERENALVDTNQTPLTREKWDVLQKKPKTKKRQPAASPRRIPVA